MSVPSNEIPESAECFMPRPARREQQWRDAVARRKLEALRELQLLRKQLTDVWDEPDNSC